MRYFIFYLIVTGILLLIDLYAWQAVRSATRDFPDGGRRAFLIAYWSCTAITVGAFTIAFFIPFDEWNAAVRMYVFSIIILMYLSKVVFIIPVLLIEDVSRLFRFIFSSVSNSGSTGVSIPRAKFIGQLAMVAGGVPLALGIHGMLRNAYNYKVHRHKLTLPNLPESFNGFKIVQISDVHSGSFVSRAPVEKGIEMINSENADVVFFTGDLVNYRADEMHGFVDVFKMIKAKEGVFSIFGNHDYADYVRWPEDQEASGKASNRSQLIDIHRSMGWDILMNESRLLRRGDDAIAIIGSENWSTRGFGKYGDLKKAREGCEPASVKLLLSHDPTHWDGEVLLKYPDIDVTFSGHTHGAQCGVEIPGWLRWSPSQYLYKNWAGLYQQGKQYLYVNRGFGFIGYHGRIGILPEITVMELWRG